MNITLYVIVPGSFTLFFNVNDSPPQLFNGNGKVNKEVLEKKREEIYGQGHLLLANQGVSNIPTLEECLLNWRGKNGAK